MLLTPHELHQQQPPQAWFCLKTQTRRESVAAAALRSLTGVEVFCPHIRFRRATQRGTVWFQEAMFPSYLFARFPYATMGRQITHLNGIRGLVHFGDRLAMLADEEIQPLIQQCGAGELIEINPSIEAGTAVTVTEGPLHGLQTIVTRVIPGSERVCILLSILGQERETEIPANRLIAASKSPTTR